MNLEAMLEPANSYENVTKIQPPYWKWRKSGKKLLFSTFSAGGNFSKAFLSKLKSILLQIESGLRKNALSDQRLEKASPMLLRSF